MAEKHDLAEGNAFGRGDQDRGRLSLATYTSTLDLVHDEGRSRVLTLRGDSDLFVVYLTQ